MIALEGGKYGFSGQRVERNRHDAHLALHIERPAGAVTLKQATDRAVMRLRTRGDRDLLHRRG